MYFISVILVLVVRFVYFIFSNTSPGYRPRRDSGEEGGSRQRRHSSNSSGKGRPGQ